MPDEVATSPSRLQAFILPIEVKPHEIDAQGHASNVAFLDWMNRAAIDHSAAVGWDALAYQRLGSMFVVKRHEIDYLLPANLGERLQCRTWVESMEKATAVRRHEIIRESDGRLAARGMNVWAFVDIRSGRPVRIPAAVLEAFRITWATTESGIRPEQANGDHERSNSGSS